jgi:hypothetical protein
LPEYLCQYTVMTRLWWQLSFLDVFGERFKEIFEMIDRRRQHPSHRLEWWFAGSAWMGLSRNKHFVTAKALGHAFGLGFVNGFFQRRQVVALSKSELAKHSELYLLLLDVLIQILHEFLQKRIKFRSIDAHIL